MGILLCEHNFRNVWIRNESVRAEIGQILHTDTHIHAAKLVVRLRGYNFSLGEHPQTSIRAPTHQCKKTFVRIIFRIKRGNVAYD